MDSHEPTPAQAEPMWPSDPMAALRLIESMGGAASYIARECLRRAATPAQALGEASGKAYEFSHDLVVVPLHVAKQHFAGLESRCESLARSLQMSEELRATSEGNLIRSAERAESAEARVRELEAQRDSGHE